MADKKKELQIIGPKVKGGFAPGPDDDGTYFTEGANYSPTPEKGEKQVQYIKRNGIWAASE